MKFKKSSDITWHDLPKIESPFFAYSKVESSFYGGGHHDVWGLDEWKRDRFGYTNYTEEAQRNMLKRDIEWGNYYLVANPPFSPLFRWIEKDGKKGYWHINAIGDIMIHASAKHLTRSVRKPTMTSTGYRPPVKTSLEEPAEPAWLDSNLQPVSMAESEEKIRTLKDSLWKNHDLLNDVAEGKEKKLYRQGNATRTHSKGEEVKLIQTALQKMDIDIGESGVDGIYGNDGHYAVMLFQENYEPTHKTHKYAWNEPDGIVGKNTLLAMDEALLAGWKYKVEGCVTDWKQGFGRQISEQNKYAQWIGEAAQKYTIPCTILKSLIAQESGFKANAHNNVGYAGLTQIGGPAIAEAGLSQGKTTKTNGQYVYDMEGDERFDAKKSIFGGAKVLKKKRDKVNDLVFDLYTEQPTDDEKWKFYLAAYNGGEGVVNDAYKELGKQNAKWEELVAESAWSDENVKMLREKIAKDDRPVKIRSDAEWKTIKSTTEYSPLLAALLYWSWGGKAKYKEVSEYVENVMARKNQ